MTVETVRIGRRARRRRGNTGRPFCQELHRLGDCNSDASRRSARRVRVHYCVSDASSTTRSRRHSTRRLHCQRHALREASRRSLEHYSSGHVDGTAAVVSKGPPFDLNWPLARLECSVCLEDVAPGGLVGARDVNERRDECAGGSRCARGASPTRTAEAPSESACAPAEFSITVFCYWV